MLLAPIGDQRAYAFVGKDLQQHRMGHAAVDDVCAGHTGLHGCLLYTSDAADDRPRV